MKALKVSIAVAKGLAIAAAMIAVASLAGCAPKAFRPGPNPLDEPGAIEPTALDLHEENIRAITGNPGYLIKRD